MNVKTTVCIQDIHLAISPSIHYGEDPRTSSSSLCLKLMVATCWSSYSLVPTQHHHVKRAACIDIHLVISPSLRYGKVL